MTVESIDSIMVKLDVDNQQSLFIVLTNDGSVNRLGTGAAINTENDLFIGRTNDPLFAQLRGMVQREWLNHSGSYEVPSKTGAICTLSVLFKAGDVDEGGLRFLYGSESEGPPADICQFVTEAVRITNPWYERQKQIAAANGKKAKPWWRLW